MYSYFFSLNIVWSDEDESYMAKSPRPELSGISAFGETPDEAFKEYLVAVGMAVDVMHEDGEQLFKLSS